MTVPLSTFDSATDRADDPARKDQFLALLRDAYGPIRACVATLVVDRVDADDVMQEVCLTLWNHFDRFEPGTSFRRWACTVAYHVARAYWRRERRRRGVGLDDEAIARLATVQAGISEVLEMRRERLADCLELLPERDRTLVREAYGAGEPLTAVAARLGRTVGSLYTRLSRLRDRLERCIEHRREGLPS